MNRYIVEFQLGLGEVEYFVCQADNWEHAEEQTINAYPGCLLVAVFVEVLK